MTDRSRDLATAVQAVRAAARACRAVQRQLVEPATLEKMFAVDLLSRQIREELAASEPFDEARWERADIRFHRAITHGTRNDRLIRERSK